MKVMIVDDEPMASEELYDICSQSPIVDEAVVFNNPADALVYTATNSDVDAAFLDIEMPVMTGLELARRINRVSPDTKIIFVTGFKEYAYEAYCVNAIGYVLKPYEDEAVIRELKKVNTAPYTSPDNNVFIKAFGNFDVFVNDRPIYFSSAKSKEFLALLVDRQGSFVSTNQAIAELWPDRENDDTVQSLFRKVLKSLRQTLAEAEISDIFIDERNQRSVDITKFNCDYYDFMKNPRLFADKFRGEYMLGYPFAKGTLNMLRHKYYEVKGGF